MIGGASPADSMLKIDRKSDVSSAALDAIVTAQIDAFLAKRRAALLDLVEEALGRSPTATST